MLQVRVGLLQYLRLLHIILWCQLWFEKVSWCFRNILQITIQPRESLLGFLLGDWVCSWSQHSRTKGVHLMRILTLEPKWSEWRVFLLLQLFIHIPFLWCSFIMMWTLIQCDRLLGRARMCICQGWWSQGNAHRFLWNWVRSLHWVYISSWRISWLLSLDLYLSRSLLLGGTMPTTQRCLWSGCWSVRCFFLFRFWKLIQILLLLVNNCI